MIYVRTWIYDGTLRPMESHFKIARTQLGNTDEGTIPLSDLPIICLAKNYELCAHLLRRGRVFWDCRYRQISNYSGPVADSENSFVSVLHMHSSSTLTCVRRVIVGS
jgi:hypothetical protein